MRAQRSASALRVRGTPERTEPQLAGAAYVVVLSGAMIGYQCLRAQGRPRWRTPAATPVLSCHAAGGDDRTCWFTAPCSPARW
jgi:hypothetical protein